MKVLFIAKSFGTLGGAERWLDLLVDGLRRRSVTCVVALADGEHHNASRYASAHPVLAMTPIRAPTGAPSGRLLAVRRMIRKVRPDVVVPLMLFDGLLGAALEKKRLGYRLVFSLHGSRPGAFQDVRDIGPVMDAVVPVDGFSHQVLLERQLIPIECIRLIPCGVQGATKETTLFSSRRIRLGYCGRLEQEDKRVLDLVGLCAELAARGIPFDLSIAGGGSQEQELRARLRDRLGESARVTWLGVREPEWLYSSFYPQIDVLIVTSRSEAGPLVAVEAMLHNCLVVSSDFVGRAEGGLLEDGHTSVVFPIGNMREAAAQIEKAVKDQILAKRVAAAGRETAKARGVGPMVDAWLGLFHELLSREPRTAPLPERATRSYRMAGRLERLGLNPWLAEVVRRATGKRFRHSTPSAEWPFHSTPDPDLASVYERAGTVKASE